MFQINVVPESAVFADLCGGFRAALRQPQCNALPEFLFCSACSRLAPSEPQPFRPDLRKRPFPDLPLAIGTKRSASRSKTTAECTSGSVQVEFGLKIPRTVPSLNCSISARK